MCIYCMYMYKTVVHGHCHSSTIIAGDNKKFPVAYYCFSLSQGLFQFVWFSPLFLCVCLSLPLSFPSFSFLSLFPLYYFSLSLSLSFFLCLRFSLFSLFLSLSLPLSLVICLSICLCLSFPLCLSLYLSVSLPLPPLSLSPFILHFSLPSLASRMQTLSSISSSSLGRTGTTHFGLPSCSSKLSNIFMGKPSSSSLSTGSLSPFCPATGDSNGSTSEAGFTGGQGRKKQTEKVRRKIWYQLM